MPVLRLDLDLGDYTLLGPSMSYRSPLALDPLMACQDKLALQPSAMTPSTLSMPYA